MNIFDILGPVMVGPSSSHTAGAVRIGLISRKLLGAKPMWAIVQLSGSFADTGAGHGTDKALIAGLLQMEPDDMRIPESFTYAQEQGLNFRIDRKTIPGTHPNTAQLQLWDEKGKTVCVQASSLGGGRILVNELNGVPVNITGELPTVIIHNVDKPGCMADVTAILAEEKINIATLRLYRDKRGGNAVMAAETDQNIPLRCREQLLKVDGVSDVVLLNLS